MSSPLTKDGGSFTGFTVRVKLRFVDCPIASVTVMVTTDVPNSSAAGLSTSLRVDDVPLRVMLDAGNRFGFDVPTETNT